MLEHEYEHKLAALSRKGVRSRCATKKWTPWGSNPAHPAWRASVVPLREGGEASKRSLLTRIPFQMPPRDHETGTRAHITPGQRQLHIIVRWLPDGKRNWKPQRRMDFIYGSACVLPLERNESLIIRRGSARILTIHCSRVLPANSATGTRTLVASILAS